MKLRMLGGVAFALTLLLSSCAGAAQPANTAQQAPAATEATQSQSATAAPATAESTQAATTQANAPAAKGDITMARATWDTGYFQAAIFQTLVGELGYNVKIIGDLPAETFYPALAKGDVDFWANGWFPLHQTFLDSDIVKGKVEPVGYQVKSGALQGFLVDKKSADQYGITSIDDFKDPKIAKVFDTNGDGKAEPDRL